MQTYFKTCSAAFILLTMFSCDVNVKQTVSEEKSLIDLQGTWELLSETKIEKEDTTYTPAAKTQRMIKILNGTHFSFVRHDLTQGKDTTNAMFVAGAGSYTLADSTYTEQLEFCSAREWENHSFSFVVSVSQDTLIQTGREKLEGLGVDRIIIEKYLRVKK